MKLLRAEKEECEKQASSVIKEILKEAIKEKNYAVLAIPGGRSVSGIFKKLKNEKIAWDKVHIFMVDERYVPTDHEDSNYKLAYENFLEELYEEKKIPFENLNPFKIEEGVEKYYEKIKEKKGFDIILLSAGEDNHVAGLYPNYSILDDTESYLYINKSPKPPSERITASRKLIQNSKNCVLLFFGDDKKEALKKHLDENNTYKEVPSKAVLNCKNVYILTDIK